MTQMPYKGQYKNPADEKKAIERTLAFNKAQRERGPGPNLGPADKRPSTFKPFGGDKRFKVPSEADVARNMRGLGSAVKRTASIAKPLAGAAKSVAGALNKPRGLGSAVKRTASTGKSVGKSLGGVGRGIARAFKFEKGGMATTSKVGKAVKRKTADVKGRAMKGK